MTNIVLWISALSSFAVAIATITLAFLNYRYVKLTKQILELQHAPHVIVTLEHDNLRPTIFSIYIKNIGKGLATDVRFELSEPIPQNCFTDTFDEDGNIKPIHSGPFVEGIPSLAPGEVREYTFGQIDGIKKVLGNRTIFITCKFKSGSDEMTPTKCPINISSIGPMDVSEKGFYKLTKDIANISKSRQKMR